MRTILLYLLVCISLAAAGQRDCGSTGYMEDMKRLNPALARQLEQSERFIQQHTPSSQQNTRTIGFAAIKIPVVVHVLYSSNDQNISNQQITSQIDALNRDFRRLNADTANTPQRFRQFAADVQIEFYLATADPKGRATNGIVRKHTERSYWMADDKIKSNGEGGDNAWDSKSYLNIWIGNLKAGLGYATAPGSDADKDGVVINFSAFGTINTAAPYNLGRTATHEVGHWLGLKHIWGDSYCGDDLVGDTPPQGSYTAGCPGTFRSSCNNGSLGDMYMNYMDFTNDGCLNLFTEGQKQRMRASFVNGGPRASLLTSKGLNAPWVEEAALPEVVVEAKIYPNPAQSEVTLNFGDDESWIGKKVQLVSASGVAINTTAVSSKLHKVNVSSIPAGMYFFKAENGGKSFLQKLIKL